LNGSCGYGISNKTVPAIVVCADVLGIFTVICVYFQAVLVYSLVDFTRAKYGSYEYPLWADGIGLCMTLASVLPIFVVAIYKLTRAPGSNIKEVRKV